MSDPNGTPIVEVRNLSKYFGSVIALNDVSLRVHSGQVLCLLGDNGAGKSTLIKALSGVHQPTDGQYLVEGEPVVFASPRDALDRGIATVYQDLAMIPLMSIARNFFLGSEPTLGWGPFRRFDIKRASELARSEMAKMGIDIRDPSQPVGTLSGGERQSVAIARADGGPGCQAGGHRAAVHPPVPRGGHRSYLHHPQSPPCLGRGGPVHDSQTRSLARLFRQDRHHARGSGPDDVRRRRTGCTLPRAGYD